MKRRIQLDKGWQLEEAGGRVLEIPRMPMQVHDILHHHGVIDGSYQKGHTESCRWVPERTWIYRTAFDLDYGPEDGEARLELEGLDTLATVRLNGQVAGVWEDCYLPAAFPVAQYLEPGENLLEIEFAPVPQRLRALEEQGLEPGVQACRYLRKTFHDFTTYLGAKPDLLKVGVFGEVALVLPGRGEIRDFSAGYTLNDTLDRAAFDVRADCAGGEMWALELACPDGGTHSWRTPVGEGLSFVLEDIALWWPRGWGAQSLYRLTVSLLDGAGALLDTATKKIGLRKVEMTGCLDFRVNKRQVKLWGANLTPVEGSTLVEDPKRVARVVQLALDCNMNTLRVWGEGNRFGDTLYDIADEKGLLVWQEFFCGHAQYPSDPEVRGWILREAEYLVRRLRHRPSILLWCGGNECFMSRDFATPGAEYLAADLFEFDFRALCSCLDPTRYYHVNSPWGGDYTNAPDEGDTHSYTNSWFVPGGELPLFVSENLRVYFPPVRSLKRYLDVETLPAPSPQTCGGLPWPEEYTKVTSADSHLKIPPVEQMYDATTPEGMVYRFGAAAGLYLRDTVELYRRGKRAENAQGRRICRGHLVWKLNATFPHIYSSMLDYYLEPGIPWYFLKRAYAPLLASIEYGDHIRVWAVNDTAQDVGGTMIAELFDLKANCFCDKLSRPFYVEAGDSALITSLDGFGQFTRDKAVRVRLLDHGDKLLAENSGFADIERHLPIPDPDLTLERVADGVLLSSDGYAHHVELCGKKDGEEFGSAFSDNYFCLFPGDKKHVRVTGHDGGEITARTAYSKKEFRV